MMTAAVKLKDTCSNLKKNLKNKKIKAKKKKKTEKLWPT